MTTRLTTGRIAESRPQPFTTPARTRGIPSVLALLTFLCLLFGAPSDFALAAVTPSLVPPPKEPLSLWYRQPATRWETEALPIGNGRLGAMFFGGTASERLQFNEITLWTGDENPSGDFETMGAYQAFGDVLVQLPGHEQTTQYRRELDLAQAVGRVQYVSGGVQFQREYFASHAHQVLVFRFTADQPGKYTGSIALTDMHQAPVKLEGDRISRTGVLPNGLQYQAQLLVRHQGGSIRVAGDRLEFSGCNTVTLYLAAGTDYVPDHSRNWHGESPQRLVREQLSRASDKSYSSLLRAHVRDYQSLFQRVSLDLGAVSPERLSLSTDDRLRSYGKDGNDPGLETLFFQFGRYLLICSSRGSLPANLQGLWNESNNPPWHSDYHSNINIQMNYWPSEPANLPECHQPFLNLIRSQLVPWRKATQAAPEFSKNGPVRGWTLRTSHNTRGGMGWKWNKPGSAWYAQHLWEHYAFGRDQAYLRDFAYPILKEICEFWESQLKQLPDGRLVVPLGWSPEHGPDEDGVSYDQEIVWDLFTNYVEAADILALDKSYRDRIAELRSRLVTPKIGRWGQLQEWMIDRDDPKDDHRHVSHLFAVYPGRQISPTLTPDLAAAAKKSLEARGDASTGWSMAWKISFWARLLDGDHAHRLLQTQLKITGSTGVNYGKGGGTYPNLFDAHPPFQIDGNFGATAGICEMLLQSHAGDIHLLPALPKGWATGSVRGLRARGGLTVDVSWKEGRLVSALIRAPKETNCQVRYGHQTREIKIKPGKGFALAANLE